MRRIHLLLIMMLGSYPCFAQALGQSSPGFGSVDSMHSTIGRSTTPLCDKPGVCQPGDCAVYRFIGTGDWNDADNWAMGIKPPNVIKGCYTIIVDPLGSTKSVMIRSQTIMAGGTLIVEPGKTFLIPGNLIIH